MAYSFGVGTIWELESGSLSGGSNGGRGGPGDIGSRNPNHRSGPPTPTDIRINIEGDGSVRVQFTDLPPTLNTGGVSAFWSISYCSVDVAGNQSDFSGSLANGTTEWSQHVLNLSHKVATVQSSFSGGTITALFFVTDIHGYIQLVGYYDTGDTGRPSLPILLTSGGIQVPDNVQTAALVVSKERTPYDVIRLDATYTPPADITKDYAGCHIHVVNYDAVSTIQEIGAMDQWDHSTGNQLVTYRLPVETGQGVDSVTLTNGSGAVVRLGGANFVAGWVGRKFVVDIDAATSQVYQISARADNDHMTITPVFSGLTGTYNTKTLNNISFYFVSIGTSGARVQDITTATSVVI